MNLEKMFGQAEPAPPPEPIPGQLTVEDCIQEAQTEEFVTETTPAGIEILYSWAPRRHYKVRPQQVSFNEVEYEASWTEVPSVTTVLGVLDKSGPLTWWGQSVGAEGVLELVRRGRLVVVE